MHGKVKKNKKSINNLKAILYATSWVIYFCTAVITGILGSKKREMQVLQ